MGDNFWYWVAT